MVGAEHVIIVVRGGGDRCENREFAGCDGIDVAVVQIGGRGGDHRTVAELLRQNQNQNCILMGSERSVVCFLCVSWVGACKSGAFGVLAAIEEGERKQIWSRVVFKSEVGLAFIGFG